MLFIIVLKYTKVSGCLIAEVFPNLLFMGFL